MTHFDSQQAVFKALADPTRRQIATMLAGETLTLNAIVDQFGVSRPAIAKHVAIMEEAGLVEIHARGREKHHTLNPVALAHAKDWLNYFDQFWDDRLAALKTAAENADE